MDHSHTLYQALGLTREIDRFERTWPNAPSTSTAFAPITWEEIERQVRDLALTPQAAAIAVDALRGWRTLSWTLPPEMMLRQVLLIAATALDETFASAPETEPEPEDGEGAPMP